MATPARNKNLPTAPSAHRRSSPSVSHPTNNYCIALQPICDADMRHVGDELLYRSHEQAQTAHIEDNQIATARVCNIAFYETGIDKLVGRRKIFVNTPYEWLLKPELLPNHPDRVVVEVLESVTGSPEILAALHKIRTLGYEVALDDFVLTPETRPLLDVASIVKVDVRQPLNWRDIYLYQARGLTLLAEKVEDLDTFTRLKSQGFELFQGFFYARPETHTATSRNRSNNRGALLRLLAELQREDTDFKKLEVLISQDPQLTFMLLKYTNSALLNRQGGILTIQQALNALGLNRLRTITMTIMMANNGPASRLLLAQALTRAAMCERLAGEMAEEQPGAAFTAGLLSMMGLLINDSLTDLLAQIPMSTAVREAILLRRHALGDLLNAVEGFENARTGTWSNEQVERFNQVWLQSQVWSTEILTTVDHG